MKTSKGIIRTCFWSIKGNSVINFKLIEILEIKVVPRHIHRPYDEYVFFCLGDDFMFSLILFIVVFLVVYFVYYFRFEDLLKKEKYTRISELVLLTRKFNLDKKKMNYKSALNGIAIINAFIMAFTITIIDIIPVKIYFKLFIAFPIILFLIFSLYFSYGKRLKKKWGKEEDGV